MAREIHRAMERTGVLVAEAGTGTGKTFAYLVPALLAGGKVIVSTGTKTLQDQLFDRDLPAVRAALATGTSTALLKGRANYVCLYRLRRAAEQGPFATREEASQVRRIQRFAAVSLTGDRADLADVPEDAPAWAHATSTRDNCLGQSCPDYGDCFVMRARRNALAADVVVINHHLFFADVALRDEGVSELLPACNTVVFDEAHQLPETARLFFGETVSSAQLVDLARDARAELRSAGGASPELEALANRLDKAARDLRLVFGEGAARMAWKQALQAPGFADALQALQGALKALRAPLEAQAERSEGLESCARRAGAAFATLVRMRETEALVEVRWVEVFAHAARLHATPLSSAELFSRQMQDHPRAWIFTSATLAVGEDFGHFTRELGLPQPQTSRWASPFDFARQALLYLPKGLPADPNEASFTDAVLDAVLLGAQSFWEGVDVRGEALSVVVIDKLPFAPPDDPVLAARIDAVRARSGNAFTELQLPQAVLSLKQGAGRLIRDETDRGVLVLCDPRLTTRAYGRQILKSLPPMKLTRSLTEVERFLAARPQHAPG